MRAVIYPSRAEGTVAAPPSKSAAHRLLICGGLADGESVIRGVADSEDVLATLDCLSALGAKWNKEGDVIRIRGIDAASLTGERVLCCRECGSTLRFLIPVCLTGGARCRLEGSATLLSRPLSVYSDIAAGQGIEWIKEETSLTLHGRLKPGTYRIPGNLSSQFISGLLFALPLLDGESRIEVLPPFESRPYVDLTVAAMEAFGVPVERQGENVFVVRGGVRYRPADVTVEGDWSNAAYIEALNLTGGRVTVTGLSPDSAQGDRVYRELFAAISAGGECLADLSDCPDLGPILFAAAALGRGGRFTGCSRLRLKESDRVAAMAAELGACGVRLREESDGTVVIDPKGLRPPSRVLDGHNDHRIVMALTVLLTRFGGTIEGAGAVRKSFPDFFDRLRALGIELRTEGEGSPVCQK